MRHVLLFVFLLSSLSALCCSCVGFGPACTEVPTSAVSAVFLGTVESISHVMPWSAIDERERSATFVGGVIDVKFRVDEAYKGTLKDKASIRTNSSEAACGFPFKKGEQYVVYAYEEKGELYTSICQRTLPAKIVRDDLQYLRAYKNLPETAEIRGNYKRYTFDPNFKPKYIPNIMDHYVPPEEYYEAMAPMTGQTITVKSAAGHEWKVQIDSSGQFKLSNLPPGRYSVSASVPARFSNPTGYAAGLMMQIDQLELLPKQCAAITFRTQPDGHLRGRVVDVGGLGLEDVEVMAWHPNKKFELYRPAAQVYAEKDGSFELGPLPPGDYIVGAYVYTLPQGYPDEAEDRDKLTTATMRFYPDARKHEKAQAVHIGLGQHKDDLRIVIPFHVDDWKWVRGSQ